MKSFFWTLSLATACFVLAGCGGDSAVNPATLIDQAPTFATTSNEPVLLRYKLQTGQALKFAFDIDMDIKVKANRQDQKIKMTMVMEGNGDVTAVDPQGNISVGVKLTVMKMNMSGAGKAVNFDSSNLQNATPELRALGAMLNVNIPCRITPVGKMLETDLNPLRMAMRNAGNAALNQAMEEAMGKMFEGTFVQLSETPVKAGDQYDAGTILNKGVKVHISYKVVSVSGDHTQAVLEPIARMEIDPATFPGKATITSQKYAGWMLFDLQKGFPTKGQMGMYVAMDISAGRETGTMEMTMKMKMTTDLR